MILTISIYSFSPPIKDSGIKYYIISYVYYELLIMDNDWLQFSSECYLRILIDQLIKHWEFTIQDSILSVHPGILFIKIHRLLITIIDDVIISM